MISRRLVPPCGYKGGKRRWAWEIATHLLASDPAHIYDVGAGSASVSLALLSLGFPASRLCLVEAGPWGAFWKAAVDGTLDVEKIERLLLRDIPDDPREVRRWVEQEVANTYSPETFLVMQSAAYGSIPVWHDGDGWIRGDAGRSKGYSARGYWEPGPSSKETKPRGTIFTPDKIIERVKSAVSALRGATVIHGVAERVEYRSGVVYIDPDYVGTSGYEFSMDVEAVRQKAKGPVFCSEQTVRGKPDRIHILGRRKEGALRSISPHKKHELLLEWFDSNRPSHS